MIEPIPSCPAYCEKLAVQKGKKIAAEQWAIRVLLAKMFYSCKKQKAPPPFYYPFLIYKIVTITFIMLNKFATLFFIIKNLLLMF
jgi:hypothetical protein